MTTALRPLPPALPSIGLAQCTVLAVEPGARAVSCRVGDAVETAVVAVAGEYAPRAGDSVLVARAEHGGLFVLGVVVALREVAPAELRAEGATVSVTREAAGDVVRLRDARGALLVEYHPGAQRCVVHAPDGDLAFHAEHGGIELSAARGVRIASGETLELRGAQRVVVGTAPGTEGPAPSLTMDAHATRLASPRLVVEGTRAEARVDEARLDARVLSTAVDRARHVVGVLEVRAERILERAKNVYRDVEQLAQTRAAQIRLIASDALQARGRRAVIKADEDVKIKAEKIYLA